METEVLRSQILELLAAMNKALDEQRWRKLPALHQRLMVVFEQYRAQETSETMLCELKETLRNGFQQIIERRQHRLEVLQSLMENHREKKEGMLAYSMVSLVSEHR
ncbi:flagellar protein FliT [Buttiauxella gaviniae]|uniref:flagellar protein FliT n=1 Tax=Buttiauxella gaviniae TaxID=82990 RepID=UPI0039766AEF